MKKKNIRGGTGAGLVAGTGAGLVAGGGVDFSGTFEGAGLVSALGFGKPTTSKTSVTSPLACMTNRDNFNLFKVCVCFFNFHVSNSLQFLLEFEEHNVCLQEQDCF